MSTTAFLPDDPKSGYPGHLSDGQRTALSDLKAKLEATSTVPSTLKTNEADYDREMLRFLRARNFSVDNAAKMYTECQEWRAKIKIDELYDQFPWPKAREGAKVGYPTFFHKTDKTGSPIHVHRIGLIDLNKMLEILSYEEETQFLWLLNEMNARERFPACTKAKRDARIAEGVEADDETDVVDTVTGVMDLSGVSLWSFWKVQGVLGEVLTICNNYYPETSNKTIIVNAPYGFSTIWSYVRMLIDQRTSNRIEVLSANYKEEILKYIPAENLPTFLGGTCECEGGCDKGEVGPWAATISH